jgi:hypothetical protein
LPRHLAAQGSHDPVPVVATAWGEALELLAPSLPAALRVFTDETVAALTAAVDGGAWAIKRQGGEALAVAVRALAADPPGLGMAPSGRVAGVPTPTTADSTLAVRRCTELAGHASTLADKLVAALSGRLFEGKESLVAALGELAARCPGVNATAAAGAIAAQAAKATATPEYVSAALDALALVGASCVPGSVEAGGVAAATLPATASVLARFGRVAAAAVPSAGAGAGGGAATATAAPSLLGGRMDEEKESEKRAQAKATAESQSLAVASAALALSAAGMVGGDVGALSSAVATLTAAVTAAGGSGSLVEGLHTTRAAAIAFARLAPHADTSRDLTAGLRGLAEAVWRVGEGEERYPSVRVAALAAGALALQLGGAEGGWGCGARGAEAVAALGRRLLVSPDGRVAAAAAAVVAGVAERK